jgi:hypothetical protein
MCNPFPNSSLWFLVTSFDLVAQIIINCNKFFIDICVGLLSNVNDGIVLRMFALYRCVQFHGLFDLKKGVNDFPPYLLGDKAYPLVNWIMMPFKEEGNI